MQCNHDCFNCPFPDCVNNEIIYADYVEGKQIERDLLFPASRAKQKQRAYNRAYYQAHKAERAASSAEYYNSHREQRLESFHRRNVENREEYRAYRKAHVAENQKRLASQGIIKVCRKKAGYSTRQIAQMIGVKCSTVTRWENRQYPANWELLYQVLPELKEAKQNG